jgi:hypothetical protein
MDQKIFQFSLNYKMGKTIKLVTHQNIFHNFYNATHNFYNASSFSNLLSIIDLYLVI